MNVASKFKLLILMSILVLPCKCVIAQEPTIMIDSIYSKILNEQRKIKILLPGEYKPGSDVKYDVVYLLDGETHFDDFSYICRFAKRQQLLPPLILVALPNTYTNKGNMRNRDFLPETTIGDKMGCGADNFIAFFKNKLIPFIDAKLPVSGSNGLYGHSLGGLFTLYVLTKEPGLFSNYYCSDPALPWNNWRIFEMIIEKFKSTPELNKTLWVNGVEETYRNVGIQKLDSLLQACAPKSLRWKISIYPDETHMSVRLKGIYDGLKYAYHGFNSKKMVEFHPNNGSLLEGKPAPVFLNGSFPEVYYTTDGSEPDTSSQHAPQMIEISAPAMLTVKWLGENRKYITASKGKFELSKVWPAVRDAKDIKTSGLRYSYYEGKWKSLPDFTRLKAVKTGIAGSSFSLDKLPSKSNFACVFEGFLKIDTDGYYNFALSSSDGSKFFLNGRELINNDGLHASDWYRSYVVPLQKGFYPVRFEYFQADGDRKFDFIYLTPIQHETVHVPFGMMYFK